MDLSTENHLPLSVSLELKMLLRGKLTKNIELKSPDGSLWVVEEKFLEKSTEELLVNPELEEVAGTHSELNLLVSKLETMLDSLLEAKESE